nr:restriction endonuclease subunit S [Actinobacillus seminis]
MFFSYYFKLEKMLNVFQANSQGLTSDTWNLKYPVLKTILVNVPCLEEQTAIGNFFKQLDDTIALHQRTLEKYQKLKISYLEKMFPKENEQFPELRFPNFTDAWEQRKLGEVATFLNGRAYKQDELLSKGKYPVLRVGNFNTNDRWYFSDLELPSKFYADNGDLLYTWATIFSPHIWNGKKVIYHYHIWKVEVSEKLDKFFLLQLLKADKSLTSNTNGSTMIHITKSEIENKFIKFPSIKEQQKIGLFFKQLDDTIALHQREVDKYKKIKQAYLEKMFV